MDFDWEGAFEPERLDERDYAAGRVEGRIYLTRSFELRFDTSRDFGHQARYAIRVFDPEEAEEPQDHWEWTEMEIHRSPQGRVQIKAMVAREAGVVRQIKFEKVTNSHLEPLLTLNRDRSQGLIDFIRALEYVDPDGGDEGVRLDEQMLRDLFRDPAALSSLYSREPEQFRDLIRNDTTADDLIALARRREVVETFRTWLEDDAAFGVAADAAGGPERTWQNLFEDNPWILGVGLGGQLLTSWSNTKLEQVVSGFSIAGAGKRVDALLKTQGPISSLVLAEIKPHNENLLGPEYRPGCWSPSRALSGAVVQAKQTAYRAPADLEERDAADRLRLRERGDGDQPRFPRGLREGAPRAGARARDALPGRGLLLGHLGLSDGRVHGHPAQPGWPRRRGGFRPDDPRGGRGRGGRPALRLPLRRLHHLRGPAGGGRGAPAGVGRVLQPPAWIWSCRTSCAS